MTLTTDSWQLYSFGSIVEKHLCQNQDPFIPFFRIFYQFAACASQSSLYSMFHQILLWLMNSYFDSGKWTHEEFKLLGRHFISDELVVISLLRVVLHSSKGRKRRATIGISFGFCAAKCSKVFSELTNSFDWWKSRRRNIRTEYKSNGNCVLMERFHIARRCSVLATSNVQ